jgi:hypothetical protein
LIQAPALFGNPFQTPFEEKRMSKMNVVPAVLMALSAAGNPSMWMSATADSDTATAATAATTGSAMPLVAMFTANHPVVTPARLDEFTSALAKASGHPHSMLPVEHCQSISWCEHGWDDSMEDC